MAKKLEQCTNYVGVACVDGTCPMANYQEYQERCIPVVWSCDECHFRKGCEDCALDGTEYCEKEDAVLDRGPS